MCACNDICDLINFNFFLVQAHYVISEEQSELESKQGNTPSTTTDPLEQTSTSQQVTNQYIIKTTSNGAGTTEVQITKP